MKLAGLPIRPLPVARRCYSVRASAAASACASTQPHTSIKTLADLKTWQPVVSDAHVEVCGWVRSVRKSSGVRFVDVTDGSSMRPVQAVVDKSLASECVTASP